MCKIRKRRTIHKHPGGQSMKDLKEGSLCIFWEDNLRHCAICRLFKGELNGRYYDTAGISWGKCVRFESEEQFRDIVNSEAPVKP